MPMSYGLCNQINCLDYLQKLIGTRDDDVSNWDGNQQTRCENEYELFDVVDEKFYKSKCFQIT